MGASIWEIIALFCLGKSISSIWVLINMMQILVFMSLWLITLPNSLILFQIELKRIVLGEFIDELEIGKHVSDALGLPEREETNVNEQKLDESRLGDDDIFTNIGPTLLIGTGMLLFTVLIAVLLVLICRKSGVSPECKERVEK